MVNVGNKFFSSQFSSHCKISFVIVSLVNWKKSIDVPCHIVSSWSCFLIVFDESVSFWSSYNIKRKWKVFWNIKSYRKQKGQFVLYSLKCLSNIIYSPYRVFTCSKILFCIFLNIKVCLISCHNLLYIWICQEKQKINFSKIAYFKGLEKKCFCKPLVKKFIWMDPKSNSKLCGDHFECPYITLE